MYGDLVAALRSDGTTGERLKPKDFLAQLNQAIPTQATIRANPKPSEIVRLGPDIIEEREKPYFSAWIYWKTVVCAQARRISTRRCCCLGPTLRGIVVSEMPLRDGVPLTLVGLDRLFEARQVLKGLKGL